MSVKSNKSSNFQRKYIYYAASLRNARREGSKVILIRDSSIYIQSVKLSLSRLSSKLAGGKVGVTPIIPHRVSIVRAEGSSPRQLRLIVQCPCDKSVQGFQKALQKELEKNPLIEIAWYFEAVSGPQMQTRFLSAKWNGTLDYDYNL